MADRPVQETLKEALALSATRVIDLFKEWDEDGDGTVSKKEFRRAVPMLGLDPVPSKEDIDALFDQWDPDGSGSIDYKELHKILRKSAEGLDASLQAGGAGAIEMDSKAKTALRKGTDLQRGSSLAKVDIDEASDLSVAEQLRSILSKNAVRVIDLFREWDEDATAPFRRRISARPCRCSGWRCPRRISTPYSKAGTPMAQASSSSRRLVSSCGAGRTSSSTPSCRRGAWVRLRPSLRTSPAVAARRAPGGLAPR